jgi:hypothetical protein
MSGERVKGYRYIGRRRTGAIRISVPRSLYLVPFSTP